MDIRALVYALVVIRSGSSALLAAYWACMGVCYAQRPVPVPILTVCEALRSLDAYRGRPVVVVGHTGFTFEGVFMSEPCEPDDRILIHGRRWVSMMQVGSLQPAKYSEKTDPDFPVEEVLLWRKLRDVIGYTAPTGRESTARTSASGTGQDLWGNWDAIYGRIDSPVRLVQQRLPLGYSGNGYGANGTVPAMIKAIQLKTITRGRGFMVSQPHAPELLEPPTIPPRATPRELVTPPPILPTPPPPPSK